MAAEFETAFGESLGQCRPASDRFWKDAALQPMLSVCSEHHLRGRRAVGRLEEKVRQTGPMTNRINPRQDEQLEPGVNCLARRACMAVGAGNPKGTARRSVRSIFVDELRKCYRS
jgi:hypothetical protein